MVVIAGGGHASRFSAILSDEITTAGNNQNIPGAVNIFAFYPVGPSPDRNSFAVTENNLPQNVAQNLLNLTEANSGAINHQLSRVIEVGQEPAALTRTSSSEKLQEENLNQTTL